jgi:hypothetical protein
MEVLCVPQVRQWLSIFDTQVVTSRVVDLGQSKGSLPTGGELVSTLSCEHALEHQIIHLELSATHEPLVIALECLVVP